MWLCVHFEQLPLNALWLNDDSRPFAVSEHQQIIGSNRAAEQQGIRPGLRISTAYAMCESLKLIARNPAREQELLEYLATQAYAFSSQVSLWLPDKIQLEVGRSLLLFQGIEHLISCLSTTFQQQKLAFTLAIGPTPKAAEVFTRLPLQASLSLWNGHQRQFDMARCYEVLASLKVDELPLPSSVKEKCFALGFKQVRQLMELPDAVLSKRFGAKIQIYFQQLLGQLPDLQVSFRPAVNYHRTLDFIDVIHSREALLFPMRRLVDELIEFLRLHQKSTSALHWVLQDSYRVRTEFKVHLADACWQFDKCMELVRLRLESVTLTGPIERITLSTEPLTDLQITEPSLLSCSEAFNDDRHFINKIRARLGVESCYRLSQQNSTVPELANRTTQQLDGVDDSSASTMSLTISDDDSDDSYPLQRPSWLLPVPQLIGFHPQKLYWDGKLTLVSQPERIEHQWWQKKIKRDYYVAQHASGIFYWVFYDHIKQRWFVQGVFA